MPEIVTALALSAALAACGFLARALTPSGALAATFVGTCVISGAGWAGASVLAAFFVLGSAVGRVTSAWSRQRVSGDAKGERRDAGQVIANGGVAAIAALAGQHDPTVALLLVTGSLGAACADTCATAVGALSRHPPRLLLVGRQVDAGTNGGMTYLGTAGAFAGALLMSVVARLAGSQPWIIPIGTVAGVVGMVADSLLGATLQGRFYCAACDVRTEWRRHQCGAKSRTTGGWRWLDNDGVNLAATAVGAFVAWLAWHWWSPR